MKVLVGILSLAFIAQATVIRPFKENGFKAAATTGLDDIETSFKSSVSNTRCHTLPWWQPLQSPERNALKNNAIVFIEDSEATNRFFIVDHTDDEGDFVTDDGANDEGTSDVDSYLLVKGEDEPDPKWVMAGRSPFKLRPAKH